MLGKLSLLAVAIGVVGSAIGALIGAIINLLPWIAELASAAVAAAGALLLIPGVIATVISIVATLKLGLQGVSDALKAGLSGDVEAFNEALKKLAPNAQAFVREVVRLKPAWDRLRMPIQNALFADLALLLRKIAELYLPLMETGLTKIAQVLNGIFRVGLNFLLQPGTASDIGQIFAAAAVSAENFSKALGPLLQILRDVVVVATTVLASLSSGLLPLVQGWAETIAQMRADGSLAKLITDGLDALKQFGALAGDLLGILKGIFSAAGGAEGGGIFGFFERLNELINSATGQKALSDLFTAFGDMAIALTPVLVVLAQSLTPIAEGLAQIAVAAGPSLSIFVAALGAALASLAPAIVALEPAIGVLATAFAPLANILSGLLVGVAPFLTVFLGQLVTILEQMAPVAKPVGEALGAIGVALGQTLLLLAPVVLPLLGLLAEVITAILTPLIPLVDQFLPMFTELWNQFYVNLQPILPALVFFMTAFVMELLNHKDELLGLFFRLAYLMLLLSQLFGVAFAEALVEVIPLLPVLIESGIRLAAILLELAETVLPYLLPFIQQFTEDGNSLQLAFYAVIGALNILYAIFWVVTKVFQAGIAAFRGVIEAFRNLRQTISDVTSSFGSFLYNAGRDLIQGLINGISSMISSLRSKLSSVASTIRNFFPFSPAKTGPLAGRGDLRYAGQNMVSGIVRGIQDEMTAAQRAANELAGIFRPGDPGLAMAGGLAGVGAGAGVGVASPAFFGPYQMTLDGRVLSTFVIDTVTGHPQDVAAATDEGHRQTASSGRKRIGDQ